MTLDPATAALVIVALVGLFHVTHRWADGGRAR